MTTLTRHSPYLRALTGIVFLCASGAALADPACPVGRLDGLRDGETRVPQLDVARMWVERDNRRQAASNGMPLCERDLIVTTANVSAIVQLGSSGDHSHDITIYPDSSIRLKKPNSLELVAGRLFASLHDVFDIWTTFGVLGARGTQFEVALTQEGLDVTQLEGETQFPKKALAAMNPAVLGKQPDLLSVDFAWVPVAYSFYDDSTGTLSVVPKGMQFTFRSKDPSALRIAKLEPGVCERVSDASSAVVSTTRAKISSRNTNLNFAASERAKAFLEARKSALCADSNAARAQLIRVYADWGQPLDALYLVSKMANRQEVTSRADVVASLALATRLSGESDQAIAGYRAALAINPRYAVAYSGIGDSYRDLGLAAYAHSNNPQALAYFDQAQSAYERALQSDVSATDAGWNQSLPLTNIGELNLFRAVVQPDQAAALLGTAEGYFNKALANAGGDAPFATVGLARANLIRAKLIPDVTVASGGAFWETVARQLLEDRKVAALRKPFAEAARALLKPLMAAHPDLSAAAEADSAALLVLGKRPDAAGAALNAIELDPHNADAYAAFAAADTNLKRKRLYAVTAASIDYPAFQVIATARQKMQRAGDIPAVAANRIVANPSTLVFTATALEQTVTVTVNGTATLPIDSVSINGGDAASFQIRGDTCSGGQFAPNQSCAITVVLTGAGGNVAYMAAAPRKRSFSSTLTIRSSALRIETSIDLSASL